MAGDNHFGPKRLYYAKLLVETFVLLANEAKKPDGFQLCRWESGSTIQIKVDGWEDVVAFIQKEKFRGYQLNKLPSPTRYTQEPLQVLKQLKLLKLADFKESELSKKGTKSGGIRFSLINLPSKNSSECIAFLDEHIKRSRSKNTGKPTPRNPKKAEMFGSSQNSLEDVVSTARQILFSYTENKCLNVRVLDMNQSVSLEHIYTEVYVNTRITGKQRKTISELLDFCQTNRHNAYNKVLYNPRIKGLEAAKKHSRILVFGKAGAGKTTFIKWLSVQCSRGNFYPDCIPVFVRLRELVEDDNLISLEEHITRILSSSDITCPEKILKKLLQDGRLLLLLDGLDELNHQNTRKLISDIKRISNSFSDCPIFLTCRFGAINEVLKSFADIEIGDLDAEQIQIFASKWLSTQNCRDSASDFMANLEQNPSIRELATNPLMLTFICLLYKEKKEFPRDRLELYREGLSIWLERWDKTRGIQRLKNSGILSSEQKQDLLSRIAFSMSSSQDIFYIKEHILNQKIEKYIRRVLPDLKTAQDIEQTRKSILEFLESEIGLLVKAAKKIYSFSHKTFQEYFTAKFISHSDKIEHFEFLSENLSDENHWLEVLMFTGVMLGDANALIQKITCKINSIIEDDNALKQFLHWSNKKSQSIESSYALAATNAFYIAGAEGINRSRHLILDLDLSLEFDRGFDNSLMENQNLVLDRMLILLLDTAKLLSQVEDKYCEQDIVRIAHDCIMVLYPNNIFPLKSIDLERTSSKEYEENLDDKNIMQSIFDVVANYAIASANDSEIEELLNSLVSEYMNRPNTLIDPRDWWTAKGGDWTEKLRKTIVEYRNIGHSWNFSEEQEARINFYLKGCKILMKCINQGFNIDTSVRESVESGLLNPQGFDISFSCEL